MEVTMISRGVEISMAGGVAETEDVNYCDRFFSFFIFHFFFITLIYCFYWGKMHTCGHRTELGTRVLGWNVSHADQNLQLQSFPLSPS